MFVPKTNCVACRQFQLSNACHISCSICLTEMFHLKLVFLHVFLVTGSHQFEIIFFFDLENIMKVFLRKDLFTIGIIFSKRFIWKNIHEFGRNFIYNYRDSEMIPTEATSSVGAWVKYLCESFFYKMNKNKSNLKNQNEYFFTHAAWLSACRHYPVDWMTKHPVSCIAF